MGELREDVISCYMNPHAVSDCKDRYQEVSSPIEMYKTNARDNNKTPSIVMFLRVLGIGIDCFLKTKVVPGWARTTNLSVNSRTR